jgi:hypothetical protein
MDQWIIIPNWDRYQHYKDRDPTWIKVYTELAHNPDWIALTLPQRGLIVTVWLLYARGNGQLRAEDVRITGHIRSLHAQLETLNDAGFLQLSASRPLALTRTRTRSRELEKEVDLPLTPPEVGKGRSTRAAGTNPRALDKHDREHQQQQLLDEANRVVANWNGGDSIHFDEVLDELEHHYGLKIPWLERDRLFQLALQQHPPVEEDELF